MKKTVGRPAQEIDPVIGQRIKASRKALKLTQDQVACNLNVSTDTIRNWENSRSTPGTRDLYQALASVLDVQVAYLMNMDGKEQLILERNENILKSSGPVFQKQQALDDLIRTMGYPGYHLQVLQLDNIKVYAYLEKVIGQALTLFDKDQQEFIELSVKYALENFKLLNDGR